MLQKNENGNPTNIFLIEDHPHTIAFYKNLIEKISQKDVLNFICSKNCEEAFADFTQFKKNETKIDLAIIDVGLSPFKDIENGADLAILIKYDFPECKIIVVTAFTEPLTIYNLLQKTSIEAVLCKSDMDHEEFIKVYEIVVSGLSYRSTTVKEKMTKIAQNKCGLDYYDLEILQQLQKGKKTADLTNYINLSLSTIEKRKANLKRIFLANGGTDKDLIEKVKQTGLLH